MKVAYYPGCSLLGTAKDYALSIDGICSMLDIRLQEVPDWNCCGATAAHSIDHRASIDLAGRTLCQASQMQESDLLVPCPMCFNRLKTAEHALAGEHRDRYQYVPQRPVPKIWDMANFFATDRMLAVLKSQVVKPLEGLNVVCYYGCMSNRPPEITEEPDYENPQSMDRIVTALGANAIPWPYKTDCCGASQLLSRLDMVNRLVGKLYDMAERVGAQAIVVSCQMCHANLDMYQARFMAELGKSYTLPIYFFSELIGLACGASNVKRWLAKHITDPQPLLRQLGLLDG